MRRHAQKTDWCKHLPCQSQLLKTVAEKKYSANDVSFIWFTGRKVDMVSHTENKKAQLTQGLRATAPPSRQPEIAPFAPRQKTLALFARYSPLNYTVTLKLGFVHRKLHDCIDRPRKPHHRTKHHVDRQTGCEVMAIFVYPRWPSAAILDFIEPQIAPFNPPTSKTLA